MDMARSQRNLNPIPESRTHSLPSNKEGINSSAKIRKLRSASTPNQQGGPRNERTNSFWWLEILYKTTDVVLVICASIFICSSIASIILWLYGIPWVNGPMVIKPRPLEYSSLH